MRKNDTPSAAKQADLPAELWALVHGALKPAEVVLAQTLQGLTGKRRPAIWLRSDGMHRVIEEQLRREGVVFHDAPDVWALLQRFRPAVKGMIVYKLGTPSLNVATSLCGPLGAVAVDESLRARAEAEGLVLLADVRGMDEREAFAKHRARFARGVLVEQTTEKPGHLRDFAVARNAFTYATSDSAFRTEVARAFGPQAVVYGWGGDENEWVRDLSRGNATGGPADWCVNLSALEKLPAGGPIRRPVRPVPPADPDAKRYIAFVMSDGDNVQWLTGRFVDDRKFWGSPLRGTFPMTWEVSPLLPEIAPRVLRHLYATATTNDGFVSGPGLPGYTFLHFQTDRLALARQGAAALKRSDLTVASVLNDNAGSLRETIPLLDQPAVQGLLYKAYAPYHRLRGETFWHRNKPCVSYRFVLWEDLMGPEDVAREVAAMPASPRTDPASYAIVNVHAWSYGKSGGPLEAVRRTLALLPSNTRVVTADQLIALLRSNFPHGRA